MKKEIFRMHNGFIRQGRILKGPFFLHFCKGEISGIITDDSFEKEMLIQFFRCKNSLVSGDFYYNEQRIAAEDRNNSYRKLISETTSVISGNSQLFESLTIVDNIFIPSFFIKRRKHKKVAARLMEFFDIDIPLHMRVRDLTTFQRLQIEILHAVACHHKLIIVSDINGMLRSKERNKLRQLYERLAQIGYAICQIESLNNISLNTLDRVQVIEKGRGVGSYSRTEIEYSEIARLINADGESSQSELLQKKDARFFDGLKLEINFLDDEEQIRNLRLPKLTLQPIVENSVRHGLEAQVNRGKISITFDQTETHLFISVKDSGRGMPEKELQALNDSLNETPFQSREKYDAEKEKKLKNGHTGIALKNVSQRIKLLFGDEYGIYIFSTPGVGTNVKITIPRQTQDSAAPDR